MLSKAAVSGGEEGEFKGQSSLPAATNSSWRGGAGGRCQEGDPVLSTNQPSMPHLLPAMKGDRGGQALDEVLVPHGGKHRTHKGSGA